MVRAAICNNMVMPYTNRLFNYISESRKIDISVISCTLRERIRTWSVNSAQIYDHVVLKGFEVPLSGSRSFHVNSGVWHALRDAKPDVVAINGIYPTMMMAACWATVYRKPLTFITDGWRQTMPRSFYHRIVRPLVINRCRSIICASEKGRQFFLDEGVSPDCIFVAPLAPAWSAPAQLPDFGQRPYHLLWCGRLDDGSKNISFFVALAVALHSRIPGFKCRIVGDGQKRKEMLECLASAGVSFDYTPNVAPESMADIFCSARMLALPSKIEPWGLVCNEAMQCGTPCIVSTHAGAADELVKNQECGLVMPLDLAQWTDAIAQVVIDAAAWTGLSKAALTALKARDPRDSGEQYIDGLLHAVRCSAKEGV